MLEGVSRSDWCGAVAQVVSLMLMSGSDGEHDALTIIIVLFRGSEMAIVVGVTWPGEAMVKMGLGVMIVVVEATAESSLCWGCC